MLKKLRSPLYLALLIPALLSLTDLLSPIDHGFSNVRYKFGRYEPTKSTVIVSLDRDVAQANDNALGTAQLARIMAGLYAQMPRRVFVDAPIKLGENPVGDRALASVLRNFGSDAHIVVRSKVNVGLGHSFQRSDFVVPTATGFDFPVVTSGWKGNFLEYGVASPYAVSLGKRTYPTLSAELSGVHSGIQNTFSPDYLVDIDAYPRIKGENVLRGDFTPGLLSGRTVIVTSKSTAPGIGFFGRGREHPLALDLAGAEALRKPLALAAGNIPMLMLVWLLIRAGAQASRRRQKVLLHGAALGAILLVPSVLQWLGITVEIGASLLTAGMYGITRLWQRRVRRVQHTSASGLPNLLALSAHPLEVGRDVVVAVIARYEEILATLPKELHGECARQIARRLSVGSGIETIFNGEGGHFAWTEEARPLDMQLDHLEGMRALFSAPLEIAAYKFDTNIHFGLDRNEGLDALTRVNSALASANDALASGRAVELFEAERLAEATWELSLHARIDEGLRNGEIWLAFQSQWDMREGLPCGAEALIRWNHPTRGPIAPDAFILQAERAGRIDALTYWVMEEAITAALALNALGQRLQMSINLSAQMVDKAGLVPSMLEIVRRRNFDPRQLTIEVTETSSVRNRPAAVQNLSQLRSIGFRLSIDDFGTGEASLAYLADLPSDELKLDRRFVSRILTHERERHIVRSTIDLAHALGQAVVAEGIEDDATYHMLGRMGCDVGQGYHLGRPQPFAELRQNLLKMGHNRFGVV